MRIWHYQLLPFLPDSLLLTLWDDLKRITLGERDLFTAFITDKEEDSLFVYMIHVGTLLRTRKLKTPEEVREFIGNHYIETALRLSSIDVDKFVCFEQQHDFFYLAFCITLLNEYYELGLQDFSDEMHNNILTYLNHVLQKIQEEAEQRNEEFVAPVVQVMPKTAIKENAQDSDLTDDINYYKA